MWAHTRLAAVSGLEPGLQGWSSLRAPRGVGRSLCRECITLQSPNLGSLTFRANPRGTHKTPLQAPLRCSLPGNPTSWSPTMHFGDQGNPSKVPGPVSVSPLSCGVNRNGHVLVKDAVGSGASFFPSSHMAAQKASLLHRKAELHFPGHRTEPYPGSLQNMTWPLANALDTFALSNCCLCKVGACLHAPVGTTRPAHLSLSLLTGCTPGRREPGLLLQAFRTRDPEQVEDAVTI